MKWILGLLALTLPLISAAQQSGSKASLPDDYCQNAMFKTLCDQGLKELREAEQAGEQAEDLRKAVEELRSADKAQLTKGVTDAGKIINSHANNNPVSKEVTDKALSVTERFAQMENGSLDNTEKSVRSGFAPTNSNTPFNASEQHQLHESTRSDVGSQPLTIEQRYQQQEQTLVSAPPTRSAAAEPEPMKTSDGAPLSVKERYNNQENVILLSPDNVQIVATVERARQKADQERRALEAKKQAAYQVEIANQAELARIAKKRADAKERYAEWLEQAKEIRAQQAAWRAAFGPPSYPIDPPPYYSPNVLYSYFPNALPYTPSVGSYANEPVANPYIHGLCEDSSGGCAGQAPAISFGLPQSPSTSTPCVLLGTIGGGCVHEDAAPYSAQSGTGSVAAPGAPPAAQPQSSPAPPTTAK